MNTEQLKKANELSVKLELTKYNLNELLELMEVPFDKMRDKINFASLKSIPKQYLDFDKIFNSARKKMEKDVSDAQKEFDRYLD